MVVFVVQTSRYFGPCRILPYPAVSCRILPYLPYPAVSCRILPYPAYPAEAVWGASPIPAAQPVALFARLAQEFSCADYGISISVGFL